MAPKHRPLNCPAPNDQGDDFNPASGSRFDHHIRILLTQLPHVTPALTSRKVQFSQPKVRKADVRIEIRLTAKDGKKELISARSPTRRRGPHSTGIRLAVSGFPLEIVDTAGLRLL
ncbi:hypothetical protein CIHG_00423 [Coccidioides immitis H538.4]|uniref:Uncharacterized protein n=2 Tax=Coccidioides immitis TaxID=5501 RepID=A0A0J8RDN5_COCIT|nr:hypothetical protein CIRG_07240 [Coccidioides immitis RMSCC 2394]KMU82641.1 hypothetical protein CIHG_00423 [Coccidioides immitis H538.4]